MYDGYIGTRYYKCTVSGSTSNLYSKMQYDVTALLKTEVRPKVKYVYYGELNDLGWFYDYKTATSSSVTYNKTYAQFSTMYDPALPANGYFDRCCYDSYVAGTKIINGVIETF